LEPLGVLVLGVGGNVSQGILKALALCKLPMRVIGACISPLSLGLYTVDRAYVSPLANDPAFVDWLIETCRAESVRAVLSGVEPVLAVLARHEARIRAETGAVCVVAPPHVLAIGDDKLETCRWLEAQGFNTPRYADAQDRDGLKTLVADCGFPLFGKPRAGKSAQGVTEIHDSAALALVAGRPGYIVQEYLGDDATEFTAGCFTDRDGRVRGSITMRRELLEGTTHRAVVGAFPDVRDEAERIAAALNPMGPCNVQMRLAHGRPVCFEINVRFSGTTPLRARLGFNDVEAALLHYVLGEPAVDLPVVTGGIALRYWNEVYVDPAAHEELVRTGRMESSRAYAITVEDYGAR
jgi:carbamoyl-phosphate synthase large subunit